MNDWENLRTEFIEDKKWIGFWMTLGAWRKHSFLLPALCGVLLIWDNDYTGLVFDESTECLEKLWKMCWELRSKWVITCKRPDWREAAEIKWTAQMRYSASLCRRSLQPGIRRLLCICLGLQCGELEASWFCGVSFWRKHKVNGERYFNAAGFSSACCGAGALWCY